MMAIPRMRLRKAQNIFTAADKPATQSIESSLPLILAKIQVYLFVNLHDLHYCNKILSFFL